MNSIAKASCAAVFLLAACTIGCTTTGANGPEAVPGVSQQDTSPPTAQLPDTVVPVAYKLSLYIDPNSTSFAGTSTIMVQVKKPVRTIWLHSQELKVHSATVTPQGQPAVVGHFDQVNSDGLARVDLPEPLPEGPATLAFVYEAPLDTHLDGLYKVTSDGTPYVFSQFEPTAARRAFVGFDEPRFKTPFEVALIVPAGNVAISNMPQMGEQVASDSPNHKLVTFGLTPPLPTYLMAFAVGPFDVVDGPALPASALRPQAVPLRGIAVHGQGPKLHYTLSKAGGLVSLLEAYFGQPYPFPKLDLIAVPDFAAGAMENAGAITFRDWMLLVDPATATTGQKIDSEEVIAHELTHQWFGDWVTMPWWDDLWLNESFATWLSYRTVAQFEPAFNSRAQAQQLVHMAMRLDSLQAARRIRQPAKNASDIINAFDGITYLKGSGVLSMFENYLGEDRMRAGIENHLQSYRFANANADQFLESLSRGANENVAPAFKTFLDQSGVPQVTAQAICDKQGNRLVVQQSRYRPVGSALKDDARWQIPLCWRLADAQGKITRACQMLTGDKAEIALSSCPAWLMPNAEGTGYYRWSLPGEQLAKLAKAPLTVREQLSLADNAGAAFSAGTAHTADVLPVLAPLVHSKERLVATAPIGLVRSIIDTLLDDSERPHAEAWARNLYAPLLKELTLKPAPHEDAERSLLRSSVVGNMARFHDAALREQLSKLGLAFLGDGKTPAVHPDVITADLVDTALTIAAETHGATVTRDMLQRLQTTGDATLRRQLVNALSNIGTPTEAALVRQSVLGGTLRSNEVWLLVARQMQYPILRDDVWAWFKQNYAALRPLVPTHQLGGLPHLGDAFCSQEKADDLQAFFSTRLTELPGADRALAQALENISLCMALVKEQQPGAKAFFAHTAG